MGRSSGLRCVAFPESSCDLLEVSNSGNTGDVLKLSGGCSESGSYELAFTFDPVDEACEMVLDVLIDLVWKLCSSVW